MYHISKVSIVDMSGAVMGFEYNVSYGQNFFLSTPAVGYQVVSYPVSLSTCRLLTYEVSLRNDVLSWSYFVHLRASKACWEFSTEDRDIILIL